MCKFFYFRPPLQSVQSFVSKTCYVLLVGVHKLCGIDCVGVRVTVLSFFPFCFIAATLSCSQHFGWTCTECT